MSEVVRLDWRGDHVRAQLEVATVEGINEVMDMCVQDARGGHPWQNRTGKAEASITKRAAKASASKIAGRWGSYRVRYFWYLEMGSSKMAARPTLRPAADRNYGKLTGVIARKSRVH